MNEINHALRVETCDISTLREDPKNARRHSRRNIDAIKQSLIRFGQRRAIIVLAGSRTVMAGNGTLAAARELGWSQIAASFIDEDEKTAKQFAIADNRTAELGAWNVEQLAVSLNEWEQDVAGALGFDSGDLQSILGQIEQAATQAQQSLQAGLPTSATMPSSFAPPIYTPPAVMEATQAIYTPPMPAGLQGATPSAMQQATAGFTSNAVGIQQSYHEVSCPSCGHGFRIVAS